MADTGVRHVLLSGRRYHAPRLLAVVATAALGALMAVPAASAQARAPGGTSVAARQAAPGSSCPWVTSTGIVVGRLGERLDADRGQLQRLPGRLFGTARPAVAGHVHRGPYARRPPGRDHGPVEHAAGPGRNSTGAADGIRRPDPAPRPARAATATNLDRGAGRPDPIHLGRARHGPGRDLPGNPAQLRTHRQRHRARHRHDGKPDPGGRSHRHSPLTPRTEGPLPR